MFAVRFPNFLHSEQAPEQRERCVCDKGRKDQEGYPHIKQPGAYSEEGDDPC